MGASKGGDSSVGAKKSGPSVFPHLLNLTRMGAALGLAALVAFLGLAVQAVTLPCESMGGGSSNLNPNVKCEMRQTDCFPGFTKVCPQKLTGCEDGEDEFCRKDARAAVKAMLGLTAGKRSLEPMDRARGKVTQEMRCGKGIPKFSCTFIFDYDPYGEVTSFRATQCNHRKKIEKCKAIVETSSGCTIRVLLSNKGSKLEAGMSCNNTKPNRNNCGDNNANNNDRRTLQP